MRKWDQTSRGWNKEVEVELLTSTSMSIRITKSIIITIKFFMSFLPIDILALKTIIKIESLIALYTIKIL